MTTPTDQYPWRMQAHHITQEMSDVWTISLACHDYYPYHAGRYTLVSVRNSAETLRAYTISSTPGVNGYITLTARRIDGDVGSRWSTCDVKRGDYLWLSGAMGRFVCGDKAEDKFLLLAAGCGVTPAMLICRQLAKNRLQADVRAIYNMRIPQDMILTDEWRNYLATLVAENNVTEGFIAGRLIRGPLADIPDLTSRAVTIYGPAPYIDWVEWEAKTLGVAHFLREKLFTPIVRVATSDLRFIKLQPAQEFYVLVGTTLLETLENSNVPIIVACRAGVCGCCKMEVISGEHTVSSTMTLADTEIAEGYVLVCSYHPQEDLVLA